AVRGRHRVAGAEADHLRVPDQEAPAGARARRLQPERVGTDAGVDLLGEAAAEGAGLDAGHLGRDRAGDRDRVLPHRQRPQTPREGRRPLEASPRGSRPGRAGEVPLRTEPMDITTVNPATGETIATYPELSDDAVSSAIAAAHEAWTAWR